eukprot:TRINITY_DN3475_c0_g1_i1.p2 TRINITY_DN3475_c0_g1~~TRINITY_DN3475_c0_g1_i1.p2  ORF type:complete len:197 (-),score=52.28 TRINITY_DN3475_c0_g1_i1:75-665(-)
MFGRVLCGRAVSVRTISRRSFASFSWKELDGVIKDEDVAKIRASVSADLAEVMSAPKEEGTVNWDYYARSISTPGIVDTIKKNYLAANKADDDLLKQDVRSKFLGEAYQDLLKRAGEREAEAKANVAELESKLASIDSELEFLLNCTMAEFVERYPDIVAKIEDEVNQEIFDVEGRIADDHAALHPSQWKNQGHHH